MQICLNPVVIMAVRRKTRRGRRRSRMPPSKKRSLFVPRRSFSSSDVKFNLHNSCQNGLHNKCIKRTMPILNIHQSEICEFSYTHWWETNAKKPTTLVRPPYMPIAPNNSTQYIIDYHTLNVNRWGDGFGLSPEMEIPNGNYEISIDDGSRDIEVQNVAMNSECTENNSILEPKIETCMDLSSKDVECNVSNHSERLSSSDSSDAVSVRVSDVEDSDYESPDDIDYFSYMQQDFNDMYEQHRAESLSKLSKSNLIDNILALEEKFDQLQRDVHLWDVTSAQECTTTLDQP